jgi:hypothetical protein
MIRIALLAAAVAIAPLAAQAAGPQLIGSGDNAQLVYDAPSRNVAGGGVATLQGSGANASVTYQSVITPATGTSPLNAAMPGNSKQG